MNSQTVFTGCINLCQSQCSRLQNLRQRPFFCWDCGHKSRRGHGCLFLVIFVCYQVEVSPTSRSLVQRSPTECGAWFRNSTIYRPMSTRIFKPLKKKICYTKSSTLYRASMTIETLYYPTDAQIYNSQIQLELL